MTTTSQRSEAVGLGPPCPLDLPRRRMLIVGTGAIGVSYLPGWCTAVRQWYGHDVRVLLTPSAQELVSPKAVAATSGNPPELGGFACDADSPVVPHKEVAQWPDLVLVAPATLNFLSRSALMLTDSLAVYATLLTRAPVVVAPSVPAALYRTPGVRGHVATLRGLGWTVVEPALGVATSDGELDEGAMPSIYEVLTAAGSALRRSETS